MRRRRFDRKGESEVVDGWKLGYMKWKSDYCRRYDLQNSMRNIDDIKPAGYSSNSTSERISIKILKGILDDNHVVPYLNENDKTPNYDGYLDLITEGTHVGTVQVQVKTLRKTYKKPSYSVKLTLLAYARKTAQLPFLLIAVDQTNNKAFWKVISPENASLFINQALDKKTLRNSNSENDSFSIQFDIENEISTNPPYVIWKEVVENHRELPRRLNELSKQLLISEEQLRKLRSKSDLEIRDESSSYVQIHVFLDKLNDLFSNEFKSVRKLFVEDFWKIGIITLGPLEVDRIVYSLFSIGWHENIRQIESYPERTDYMEFTSQYPSMKGFVGSNPIFSDPTKYAYEVIGGYLKQVLQQKMLWPNSQYLQQEFLFHLKDTRFRNQENEVTVIDLGSFKEQIEEFLSLITESQKRLMKEFPGTDGNLFRALDYIQNLRIEGNESINRLSPSYKSIGNISTSVGEKGIFPENIESILYDYWNTLLTSYENVLDEFFPLIKDELSNENYTYIIIPFVQSPNIASLSVLKFKTDVRKKMEIIIEMNEANLKVDFRSKSVLYKGEKYEFSYCKDHNMSFSSLNGDLPIRKGIYNLLTSSLKDYFENR